MVSTITHGIEISVEVQYQKKLSNLLLQEHVFAYRITIENHNDYAVQLHSRVWHIYDSNGDNKKVEGDGVVGLFPTLFKGKPFSYSSACYLKSDMGKMSGKYIMMELEGNKKIEVQIPKFDLIAPYRYN